MHQGTWTKEGCSWLSPAYLGQAVLQRTTSWGWDKSKHLKLENNVTCLTAKQKDEHIDSWTPALKTDWSVAPQDLMSIFCLSGSIHIVPQLSLTTGKSSSSALSGKVLLPAYAALCPTVLCAIWEKCSACPPDKEDLHWSVSDACKQLEPFLHDMDTKSDMRCHFCRCCHVSHDYASLWQV